MPEKVAVIDDSSGLAGRHYRNSNACYIRRLNRTRYDSRIIWCKLFTDICVSYQPFAQPRNVIGGHVIATFTGLVFMTLFGIHWWSMAMAVGTAIALMLIFRMPHPPAGSNPLIVMLGAVNWSFDNTYPARLYRLGNSSADL